MVTRARWRKKCIRKLSFSPKDDVKVCYWFSESEAKKWLQKVLYLYSDGHLICRRLCDDGAASKKIHRQFWSYHQLWDPQEHHWSSTGEHRFFRPTLMDDPEGTFSTYACLQTTPLMVFIFAIVPLKFGIGRATFPDAAHEIRGETRNKREGVRLVRKV